MIFLEMKPSQKSWKNPKLPLSNLRNVGYEISGFEFHLTGSPLANLPQASWVEARQG